MFRNKKLNNISDFILTAKNVVHNFYYAIFHKKNGTSILNPENLKNINLLITSVAFNNTQLIKLQHHYLKIHLNENFTYLIADNSTIQKESDQLVEYCNLNKLVYAKLSNRRFKEDPSKSHGNALNCVYEHIILKFQPTYFGFIDHDIIPFKRTTIINNLNNGYFGLVQNRKKGWYLWPGFCFYQYEKIKNSKINFMPCPGLDTGGANFESLYKKIDINNIPKIKHLYLDAENKEMVSEIKNYTKTVEILGDWVHLMHSSNWNNDPENNKLDKIEEILELVTKMN